MDMPRTKLKKAAYIVTGPTSGIGRETALRLAKYGTIILVGRDPAKLAGMQKTIERRRGSAVCVVCDLSDLASMKRAAAEIVALNLPVAGLLNNAGMRESVPTKSAQGWDMSYATNHIGPFVLTEALIPHLADGTNVLFVASAVEDPGRPMAKRAGFRGGRYISAEASARGEWKAGGSKVPGFDSYATTKQCALATALQLARENPRLHINAVEPGLIMTTGLGRDAPAGLRFMVQIIFPLVQPFVKVMSTPKRAARVLSKILLDKSGASGVYYDESGHPMKAMSPEARDPGFTARVVTETRALLGTMPG
jgi:NAD(P)-dependent dehydrogenase (short-subunit alcohol dehydrogenase family)